MNIGEVRKLFTYNPQTGIVVRNQTTAHNAKVGDIVGCVNKNGYLVFTYNKKVHYLHRFIWFYVTGAWPQHHIDHRDGNKTNNAWSNLRDVPAKTNNQNMRKASKISSTQLLGAFPTTVNKTNPFRSYITVNGSLKNLGYFKTAEEAHLAYITAKRFYHEGCTI
jgi:hypothetical protein